MPREVMQVATTTALNTKRQTPVKQHATKHNSVLKPFDQTSKENRSNNLPFKAREVVATGSSAATSHLLAVTSFDEQSEIDDNLIKAELENAVKLANQKQQQAQEQAQ
jgi:hypothetical protein